MSELARGAPPPPSNVGRLLLRTAESADFYDRSIDWEARFERELPLIRHAVGLPGKGGIVDAGCGTGRHAVALAQRGYAVTAIDISEPMVQAARRHVLDQGVAVRVVCCGFDELPQRVGGGFDGVACVGNSLAAAGSEEGARRAVHGFAAVLRPGGRLIVQVLNFPPMREQVPCVRGPRVTVVDDVEYVSVRLFSFRPDPAAGPQGRTEVTGVTLWHDGQWRHHAHSGTLYPLTPDELTDWCGQAGLRVVDVFGAYDRSPLDPADSPDLILIAERKT